MLYVLVLHLHCTPHWLPGKRNHTINLSSKVRYSYHYSDGTLLLAEQSCRRRGGTKSISTFKSVPHHYVIWASNVSEERTQLSLPFDPSTSEPATERCSSTRAADLCRHATASVAARRNKQRVGTLLWTALSACIRARRDLHRIIRYTSTVS